MEGAVHREREREREREGGRERKGERAVLRRHLVVFLPRNSVLSVILKDLLCRGLL